MDTQTDDKTEEKKRIGDFDVMFRFTCFEEDDSYSKDDIEKHRLYKLVKKYLKDDEFMSNFYETIYDIGFNHFIVSFNCKETQFIDRTHSYEFRNIVKDEVYYTGHSIIDGRKVYFPGDIHHRLIACVELIDYGQLIDKKTVH
jgi:hypothetical protein